MGKKKKNKKKNKALAVNQADDQCTHSTQHVPNVYKKHNAGNAHKGKNMFGFGKNTPKKHTPYQYGYKKEVVPTTGIDSTTMSTVLFRQSILDTIGEMCLPTAGDSEFQVHYRSLQIIIGSKSGQRLVVTIPTVFFNMPQKVSRASVDFNLDEVSAVSEQVAPVSEALSEKFLAAFPVALFENLGFTIEAREAEIGSMHRHPGAFGFSGTDLGNRVKKPGVIFRTMEAEDRIQVDSVMYIPEKSVNIYTTETRVIDVTPTEDGEGISGTYLRTPTFSYIYDDTKRPVDFFEFFGRPRSDTERNFVTDHDESSKEYKEMIEIFNLFLDNLEKTDEEYEPILIIDPELIVEEYTYAPYGGYGRNAHATRTWPANRGQAAKTYDAYTDEYMDAGEEYEHLTAPHTPAPHTGSAFRPTWRKVQALGMLTSKGIDVNNNLNIDGSGSIKDVRSIRKAMEAKDFLDEEIDAFFIAASYTEAMLKAADETGV